VSTSEGFQPPEPVREEWRKLLRRALEDDVRLDALAANFTATLCDETPKLAAYQASLLYEHRIEEVRAWWAKRKKCPDPRWWPRIVAQCVLLDAAWNGRAPRSREFEDIVRDYLDITEEEARVLVRFSNCHEHGSVFHGHWRKIMSNGPGLKDMLKAARQ